MRLTILLLVALSVGLTGCSQGDPTGTPAAGGDLFKASRDTQRGFERVREVERHDNVSVVRVETNFYGGALGSASFGMECLNGLCKARGFTHWVILRHEAARTGDLDAPGNDWSAAIGLLKSATEPGVIPTLFPDLAEAQREYQVYSAESAPTQKSPMSALKSGDVWDIFSSIHFRYTK